MKECATIAINILNFSKIYFDLQDLTFPVLFCCFVFVFNDAFIICYHDHVNCLIIQNVKLEKISRCRCGQNVMSSYFTHPEHSNHFNGTHYNKVKCNSIQCISKKKKKKKKATLSVDHTFNC